MKQLNQREKIAVGIGGGALFLFVLFQFIVFPLTDGRDTLIKRVSMRSEEHTS